VNSSNSSPPKHCRVGTKTSMAIPSAIRDVALTNGVFSNIVIYCVHKCVSHVVPNVRVKQSLCRVPK
jgi:hypothetical protein